MVSGFKEMAVTGILIGIFVLSMISFGIYLAADNDTNVTITDNDIIDRSFSNFSQDLNESDISAETQRKSFFNDIPIIGEASLILGSMAGVVRVFFNTITSFFDLTINLISQTFGISPTITKSLSALIIIITVLLSWRVYKSGS